ncbi:hypothetical protein ABPG72_022386 [Tetrahymena utriculariae]
MDKVLKLSQQFYRQYKQLKNNKKDINTLNQSDLYTDLRLTIDHLDIDKIFRIKDDAQFGNNLKLGFSKLHEEEGINIGIFYISQFGQMPLHDHPDMFVFTRPIHGKAKKTFFTLCDEKDIRTQFEFPINFWLNESFDQSKEVIVKAQVSEMHLLQKGDQTQVVEPIKNNLHEIIAVENYAFLDVIIPDYDMMNAKRFCNFYTPKKLIDPNQYIYEMKIQATPEEYDIQEVQSPLIMQKIA